MNNYSSLVLEKLKELVPKSVYSEITCFTFYDENPRDKRTIDVTVCSERGLVQEFYKREAVKSLLIPQVDKIEEIQLLRNTFNELMYFVASKNEIIILSRDCETDNIEVFKRITGVHSYFYDDLHCKYQPSLRVYQSPAVLPPLQDNEDSVDQRNEPPSLTANTNVSMENLGIMMEIVPELIECEERDPEKKKVLIKDFEQRQKLLFEAHRKTFNNLVMPVTPLKVKLFNKKIMIISSLQNTHPIMITDVAMLIHFPNIESYNYTTKMFNEIPTPPYWEEVDSEIACNKTSTLVALVDYKEGNDTMKSIEFDVAVSFKRGECSKLLSLGSVHISIADLLQDKNVLFEDEEKHSLLLSVISTSKKVKLCLKQIKEIKEDYLTVSQIFCTYLKMDPMGIDNVFIHKKHPGHILYGVVVVYEESDDPSLMNIQVYSRSYWQVLTLINYMYDAIPNKIIATTTDYEYVNIIDDIVNYKDVWDGDQTNLSMETLKACSSAVVRQIMVVKNYIEYCQRRMQQDRNNRDNRTGELKVKNTFKVGMANYKRFRNHAVQEGLNFVKILSANKKPPPGDLTPFSSSY